MNSTYRLFNASPTVRAAGVAVLALSLQSPALQAEGSRSLYPGSYEATGARANLDIQPGNRYMDRIIRRGFNYVYAEAGEYILLGSSNRTASRSADVLIFNPQDFGIPGDETLPSVGSADYSCANGSIQSGIHYAGATLGRINSRSAELAGPHSADGVATVSGGFQACAYQAPVEGIYGVQFLTSGGDSRPNGDIASVPRVRNSVAAWDITVRADAGSTEDIDGRVYTYAFVGYTGSNDKPVFSTLYYVTRDGYRYRQQLRGLDPNGYALYANTFGFLDNNEPLYKTLRGSNAQVEPLPLGVTAQQAEYPIFFSDIEPGQPAAAEAEKVLTALGIPLVPPSPQISNVEFTGSRGSGVTSTGVGGTFRFDTSETVSYQIVISRDGVDFDPATPENRLLTGIAFSGQHVVAWDGLGNDLLPFPASAQPYEYRAYGRNGEVHFPIIDAENNGRPTDPERGGPTITRLNGADPGDTTVFYDDRGYVTRSGDTIGDLNGDLCAGVVNAPEAASNPVSLAGVDSTGNYRDWEYGNNRNRDCVSGAGWGDAKGVNLWTYFLTPEVNLTLRIEPTPVDVATSVTLLNTAEPGETVQGTFSFANHGTTTANGVTFGLALSPGLGTVTFASLPSGVGAFYDDSTGTVTFSGLPTTLAAGALLSGMTFNFTAPASGEVLVDTRIDTTDTDSLPANNAAMARVGVGPVDLAAEITGVPSLVFSGEAVTGSVLFSNLGSADASGVTYQLSVSGFLPADFALTNLPAGITAAYDMGTGEISLSGVPDTLTAGQVLSLSFLYSAPPPGGPDVVIDAVIDTSSSDANAANNLDRTATEFVAPPGSGVTTPPAVAVAPEPVPGLPLPMLWLLVVSLAGAGSSRLPLPYRSQ